MLLETVNLVKNFGGVQAVSHVDLQIEQGEMSSIIGPNGAGKTTLFSLIVGHIKNDSGNIFFKGEDITGLAPHQIARKGISRTFQKANILPGLTVFENVQLAVLCAHGKSLTFYSLAGNKFGDEVFAILDDVGLSNEAGKLASALALGDRKRLEIGIALGTSPELLLLDEPTSGVSPSEAKSIITFISSLASKKGLTVLFIEHDMGVVLKFSNKIRVMHQGRIITSGKPAEVSNNPEVQKIYLGEEAE
jgi:branched-chain amino acid transport system ATP-binding protein